MSQAKPGDTVKVHYTLTLDDGTEFDSSRGREPLELTLGAGRVIPGFDAAVTGMSVGDTKTVTIPAAEGYGPHHEHLTQEVPRNAIPDEIELTAGMVLQAQGPETRVIAFTVLDFDDERVRIDGNHPLAGKDLTFDLELVEIA